MILNTFHTGNLFFFGGGGGAYANGADPVQMAQNAASDQSQHCLLTGISMQYTTQVKTATRNSRN